MRKLFKLSLVLGIFSLGMYFDEVKSFVANNISNPFGTVEHIDNHWKHAEFCVHCDRQSDGILCKFCGSEDPKVKQIVKYLYNVKTAFWLATPTTKIIGYRFRDGRELRFNETPQKPKSGVLTKF
jgi:hypothetical protein